MGIIKRTQARWRLVIAGLGLLTIGAAPVPGPKDQREAFDAFKALVGEWSGEGVREGVAYRDRYRFELAALGHYIRSDYVIQDMAGEMLWHDFGAYGIDPVSGRFFTHGFGSDGATANSELESFTPDRWVFLGRTDGSPVYSRYRFTLTLTGADTFTAVADVPGPSGDWQELFRGSYTRGN